jgi:hypothetical protein
MMNDIELVRRNIRTYSEGVFDVPPQQRQPNKPANTAFPVPEMPSRAEYARLSRAYLDSIHELYPIIHWPTFQHEVDQAYTSRSFQSISQDWIGLFFAVMACGTLQPLEPTSPKRERGGFAYYEISTRCLAPETRVLTTTHAQAALLLSIFATETSMKSAGSLWLASAVRIAQELSLNVEMELFPVVEGEVRRRLWWSIYTWDRCVLFMLVPMTMTYTCTGSLLY